MPTKITASEQNLVKVFSDEYFFEIPLYQRPYAWTKEEVGELLDDLIVAMDQDSDAPYFLGSIVLIKKDGDAMSQVVDGQQRLTTLTMLLCVLRDISEQDETKRGLNTRILEVGDRLSGTKDRFRLSLRERDREFFQQHVQRANSIEGFLKLDPVEFSDSQTRIFENVKYLREKLLDYDEQRRYELARYIIQNCFLVVVSASDGDSAHRIFSVMNDRGLYLSPTDILKAEVLGKLSHDSQDEYAAKWEGIEEELGRDNFRDLFAHIRMIYRKEKLRGTLQKEFQDHVLGDLTPEKAMQFVDDVLEPYARVYQTVSRASYESSEGAEKVNELLKHLGRLDNFDWIPPAIAYFRHEEGDRDSLIKFIRDLERLAYSLFIRRSSSTERINKYTQVLSAIEGDEDLFNESSSLQLSLKEKQETLSALNGDIYKQTRVIMPLLLRLDSLIVEAGATYEYPSISVEHVLPQNPAEGSQWTEWFPDADERAHWTHRLANLVLLSRRKNTQASNYEFDRKKSEYFQRKGTTTFALTTKTIGESEWIPEILERRQHELIDVLKKEWRLG